MTYLEFSREAIIYENNGVVTFHSIVVICFVGEKEVKESEIHQSISSSDRSGGIRILCPMPECLQMLSDTHWLFRLYFSIDIYQFSKFLCHCIC